MSLCCKRVADDSETNVEAVQVNVGKSRTVEAGRGWPHLLLSGFVYMPYRL